MKSWFRTLIERTDWIVAVAEEFCVNQAKSRGRAVLAADKGFCPNEAKFAELAERVDTLAIPKRMRDFVNKMLAHWQAFRAGIEGTISGLKRAFRLIRCFFKGFRSFASAVGLGVFCHNLIVLAEHGSG